MGVKRVLLTGAGGRLGSLIREDLHRRGFHLRLLDHIPVTSARKNEEAVVADLADEDAIQAACENMDAIVHFAAVAREADFVSISRANIAGTFNIYEGARKSGVPRVVLASSHHVVGFYRRGERVGPDDPIRPDSLYAASKGLGEAMGRLYFDKFGIEGVAIRIGSCTPVPLDRRMLSTWLSPRDLCSLVERSLIADAVGYKIVFGVSNNRDAWWHNPSAEALGWLACDRAEAHAGDLRAEVETEFQGGVFTNHHLGTRR